MNDVDVIVLGAGLSGLAAAHALKAAGRRVCVVERRAGTGGRIHSERVDGFLMEHGPTSIAAPAPGAEALVERLGLGAERLDHGGGVKHRYLVRGGAVRGLPIHPLRFFLSDYFTLAGRLRLMVEPFIGANGEDETVADFVRRRFGREMLDYVFDPLIGGLHSGDPENLSMTGLLPRLKEMERRHGSIAAAIFATRFAGGTKGMPGRRLFSFRDGMAALPRALANALGDSLVLGARAETVMPAAGGTFRVRIERGGEHATLGARTVIVALPAYGTAGVLAATAPEAAVPLGEIPHPPLAVVFLGYRAQDIAHPLDGLGFLVPRLEGRQSLGMLFSSTLYAGRAPDGHVALTAFVGGARQPELARLPAAELQAAMAAEADVLLGARKPPVVARTRYWTRGLPQYTMGHPARIARARAALEPHPGLFLTGNYLGGVSVSCCIDQALATAERAESYLQDRGAACFPTARAADWPA